MHLKVNGNRIALLQKQDAVVLYVRQDGTKDFLYNFLLVFKYIHRTILRYKIA